MRKLMIILATAAFGTLSAQTSTKKADIHLQQIIDEYSDCCVGVEYDEVGVLYTFQGNGLVIAVIDMINKYYPEVHGISGSPGNGVPCGFTDTEGKTGVFMVFQKANQDELVLAYNK